MMLLFVDDYEFLLVNLWNPNLKKNGCLILNTQSWKIWMDSMEVDYAVGVVKKVSVDIDSKTSHTIFILLLWRWIDADYSLLSPQKQTL